MWVQDVRTLTQSNLNARIWHILNEIKTKLFWIFILANTNRLLLAAYDEVLRARGNEAKTKTLQRHIIIHTWTRLCISVAAFSAWSARLFSCSTTFRHCSSSLSPLAPVSCRRCRSAWISACNRCDSCGFELGDFWSLKSANSENRKNRQTKNNNANMIHFRFSSRCLCNSCSVAFNSCLKFISISWLFSSCCISWSLYT